MAKRKVCVTGATGFVGRTLVNHLNEFGSFGITAIVRNEIASFPSSVKVVKVGNIGADTDWSKVLIDCDCIVHTAARVHVMSETTANVLAEFRKVNVQGTINLARQAARAGVRRFIFISSIKVNGEMTVLDKPFLADDVPAPVDPYGVSKMEAENGLLDIAAQTSIEVVIIRPPLVYGPGVKANFLNLMNWIWRGIPLPLGMIYNKRSFVALDNLIDFIVLCIDHPAAANQKFLVSDDEDLSTTELIRRVGDALGKPARLLPVPVLLLTMGAAFLGKVDYAQRLCCTLQVDIAKAKDLLGWSPPVKVDKGLCKAAVNFLENHEKE